MAIYKLTLFRPGFWGIDVAEEWFQKWRYIWKLKENIFLFLGWGHGWIEYFLIFQWKICVLLIYEKSGSFSMKLVFHNRKTVIEKKHAEWQYLLPHSLVEYGNFQVLNPKWIWIINLYFINKAMEPQK